VSCMRNDTSRTLYEYWNKLRGARSAPRRFEVEPARLAGILPEAFIVERLGADTYRYRLAGTKLCEQFGFELRGRDFLDFWDDAEDRFTLKRRLAAVVGQAAVALFEFEAISDAGHVAAFEVVL